ncbi:MAG: hypothetical protein KKF41_01860 [Actinobacteria bacterium]|nr:hypothetical protein [Actinomycetota bacterium]MBU1942440.1 hypothetical protein [Actinomycetota bacterium]MBU2686312.1 hypothetical protein [Actinomycetota bacterium]
MKPQSGGMKWIARAALAAALCSALIAAVAISPAPKEGSKGGVVSIQKALAGDFSGAGLADRYLLGLFSGDFTDDLKTHYPASEWPWVRNARLFVNWKLIEQGGKGHYAWSSLDQEINSALSLGLNNIMLTISGPCPTWATNPNNLDPKFMGVPKKMSDWADFCGAVAARYRDVVDFYQVWQEPGWDSDAPPASYGLIYFSGYCDYQYLGLLRSAYQSIKAADPESFVSAAAMMNGITRSANDFHNYDVLLSGGNLDVSMKVSANRDIVAERPMYFNYQGTWPGGNVELGVQTPNTTWYLAEGATHPGFEEWISIQNPQNTDATVNITYMFPGGGTQPQTVSVGAHSRYTVDVNAAVGPDKNVSAKVESSQPVVVERPMYFMYHGVYPGGSIGAGVTALSTEWFLAEGATHPGFEEWISLMNPGGSSANVKITYMFDGGGTQVQNVTMPPTSRETVLVNDIIGPNRDVSAMVESSQPIIAERPVYFNYQGKWPGGSTQFGATQADSSWFLSEGTTRNNGVDGQFDEWICIQNPGNATAEVDLTYMFTGGGTQAGHVSVPAHSRETVNVDEEVGDNQDVSVQLDSSQDIVVERATYYDYHNTHSGGDAELGCTAAGKEWYFAEGTTRSGFEEWLTLQNPNAADTAVTITYMFTDGTTQEQSVNLPPNSRTTVGVNRSLSMVNICDSLAIHPYDYPDYWAWYYNVLKDMCAAKGFAGKEIIVSEIGWPWGTMQEFSPEGQRQAIGEVGLGGLWGAGCRKIWVFEDIDIAPGTSPGNDYYGLYDYYGNPHPAWGEYKNWQTQLPDYGNKPNHFP